MLMVLSHLSQAENGENANTSPSTAIHLNYERQSLIRTPIPVRVKKAIDNTTLIAEDGKIYALTGLDIPQSNTAPDTYKRLSALTEGQRCALYQTRNAEVGRLNRMNQILGHLTCGKDDVWIQGTLIAQGLARVRTTPENNQLAAQLLTLETAARDKKLGLWGFKENTVLSPETAKSMINRFVIVEGKIYTTAQNKENIFLNFTSDWKTDFSIGIPSKLRRDFSKKQIDLMSLRGKSVRVRGWMRDYNGPYIELDHADQLEIITNTIPSPSPLMATTSSPSPLMGEGRGEGESTYKNNTNFLPLKTMMHTINGPTAPIVAEPQKLDIQKPDIHKNDTTD